MDLDPQPSHTQCIIRSLNVHKALIHIVTNSLHRGDERGGSDKQIARTCHASLDKAAGVLESTISFYNKTNPSFVLSRRQPKRARAGAELELRLGELLRRLIHRLALAGLCRVARPRLRRRRRRARLGVLTIALAPRHARVGCAAEDEPLAAFAVPRLRVPCVLLDLRAPRGI
jgi:hypothetical protein